MNRLELIQRLPGEQGPLVLLDWWRRGLIALDDPRIREIMLLLARQTGKSQFAAACAASELMCRAGSFTLLVSASEGQQRMIFERKLRQPLERLLRARSARGIQKPPILFTASGAEVPSTGAVLEVIAPHMQTAPARSPTLLILDECRYIPDEVFSVLAPSVIGASGKILMLSTAGPPRGWWYEAWTHPTPQTWQYASSENQNPYANQGIVEFLRGRLALLFPAAARRELDNQFVEDGSEFLPVGLIEQAVDDSL